MKWFSNILIFGFVLCWSQAVLAELHCLNKDDPLTWWNVTQDASLEIQGVYNERDQEVRIHENPTTQIVQVPQCDASYPRIYRYYAFDRLEKGSFPTYVKQCVSDFDKRKLVADKCNDIARSAFLSLPDRFVLEQTNGTSTKLPRVGPYGTEEGDARDPNGFLYPVYKLSDAYFTIYAYPDEEGWKGLYPTGKRVCHIEGEISNMDLPTITVTKDSVKMFVMDREPTEVKIKCLDKAPAEKAGCPVEAKLGLTLTIAGNGRIRPLTADPTGKFVDVWGKDQTVKLEAPCGKPLDILVDMFAADSKLPANGEQDKWDKAIKPTRHTLCTFSGSSKEQKTHIHFGDKSAESNHNLGRDEWWSCKDQPLDVGAKDEAGPRSPSPSPSSSPSPSPSLSPSPSPSQ